MNMNYIQTIVDTSGALPIDIHAMHGESVLLNVELRNYGEPIITAEQLTCKTYYQELDTASPNEWYESDDAVILHEDDSTAVEFFWSDKLDGGADAYRYFIRVENGDSISYAIRGNIYLAASPGFTPNEIELPIKVLDFSSVLVQNAPYYTKGEMDTELEAIDKSLDDHAKSIEDLREEITGGAEETLKQHEENYSNPHRVKAAQLTEKASGAGSLNIVFNDENQGLSGSFNFGFDPSMYNEGALSFSLNVGEYAPPPIASKTLSYNGNVHLAFFDNGNPVFVTDTKIEGIYFYVSTIYITTTPESTTTKALLFFMIGGTQDAQSISDVTPFGDVLAQYATSHTYISSGTYQVLTESMLRDKVTGKAFTICVENGELKLQEYRATKYEA